MHTHVHTHTHTHTHTCTQNIVMHTHKNKIMHTPCNHFQICQVANFAPDTSYDIADVGSEEIWIDTDGTPYLFYTGPSNRYYSYTVYCGLGYIPHQPRSYIYIIVSDFGIMHIHLGRLKCSFIVIIQPIPQQRLPMEMMQSFFTMYL